MRVKLNNPKKFFDEILSGKSLRKFCSENKINYNPTKRWRGGGCLIPKEVFDKILPMSKNRKYWLKNAKYFEDNWGTSKGGKESIGKLSRKQLLSNLRYVRSKRKIPKVPEIRFNKFFLEFYGALMGDGCLCKVKRKRYGTIYYIIISGHKILDKDYHENYLIPLIKKEFNLTFKIKEDKYDNGMVTRKISKDFFLKLKKIGFPVGVKGQKLMIPKRFYNLNWKVFKFIIRGLFDTDGCIYARKDEKYRYPHIKITSKSKKLVVQVYNILIKNKYPVRITKAEDEIILKGIKNTKKWMKDIGSSNKKHLYKYKYWLKHGNLPAHLLG